jgi:hypothetical protein
MTKKIIFAVFVAALAFTSCHKDPTPTPTPEPQNVTRMASSRTVKTTSAMTTDMYSTMNWENGILMNRTDSIVLPIMTTVYHNKCTYENDNLVKIEEESGKWQYTFTYEDGLLKTYLNVMDNDTSAWGEVTAYTEDGYVKEIMDYNNFSTTRWTLTWVDGDATEVTEEIIAPEDMVATHVYTYTYDDKTCAFTGTPLASTIFDGNGNTVARRISKHNQIEEGYNYEYDENGLLVSVVAENDSTFYQYIQQTLK